MGNRTSAWCRLCDGLNSTPGLWPTPKQVGVCLNSIPFYFKANVVIVAVVISCRCLFDFYPKPTHSLLSLTVKVCKRTCGPYNLNEDYLPSEKKKQRSGPITYVSPSKAKYSAVISSVALYTVSLYKGSETYVEGYRAVSRKIILKLSCAHTYEQTERERRIGEVGDPLSCFSSRMLDAVLYGLRVSHV